MTEMIVKRSPELEAFAGDARRRFIAGDAAWFQRTTAEGEVTSFGTAPEEQSRGRDAVLALTLDELRAMNADAGLEMADPNQIDDDVIEAYEAGDAGWIVTHSRITMDDGSWVPLRVITIAVRDPEAGWQTVLSASQLVVPNDLLQPGSPLLVSPPGDREED
jgi:hypothetical protein